MLDRTVAVTKERVLPLKFAKIGFDPRFAVLTTGLLLVEFVIARFPHNDFVRPFLGDALVVILLFAFCRTFVKFDHRWLALGVLLLAFAVELGQYVELVRRLGLESNALARLIIGVTFDVRDLFAYAAGIGVVLGIDAWVERPRARLREL